MTEINNIPIKYLMNIWKSVQGYPSKLDVFYEVYSHLNKTNKTEFSEQSLNSLWYDSTGSGNWKGTQYEHHFIELQKELVFKETKNVNGKIWYVINDDKNPFKGKL